MCHECVVPVGAECRLNAKPLLLCQHLGLQHSVQKPQHFPARQGMVKRKRQSRMCRRWPVQAIAGDLDEPYDVIAALHIEHPAEASRT